VQEGGDRMSTTVTVTVTAEHIAAGVEFDCVRCPVALAMQEALPDADLANYASGFKVFRGSRATEILFPDAVTRFVVAFDAGEPVEPFTFTVDLEEVAA
jgi:hypothetical protein